MWKTLHSYRKAHYAGLGKVARPNIFQCDILNIYIHVNCSGYNYEMSEMMFAVNKQFKQLLINKLLVHCEHHFPHVRNQCINNRNDGLVFKREKTYCGFISPQEKNSFVC